MLTKGRRTLSLLLALVLLFGLVAAGPAADASGYHDMTKYFKPVELSGNGAADVAATALAQVGKTGWDLGYKDTDPSGGNWCAVFVLNCAKYAKQAAAVPFIENDKTTNVAIYAVTKAGGRPIYDLANRTGKGKNYGSRAKAAPGDLIVFDWGSDGIADHIEIITNVNTTTGKITSVGGNTGTIEDHRSRPVSKRSWNITDKRIVLIVRPNYTGLTYPQRCDDYDSNVQLTVKQDTAVMSLPCTSAVNSESVQSGTLTAGQAITGTKLYKNTKGEYWYKVSGGYVYAGNTSAELNWGSVTVTDVTGPKGSRSCGASLSLKGTVSSSLLPLQKVGAYVYPGSAILPATGQKAETGSEVSISKKSYSIAGTDVDNKCKIGSLYAGPHTYIIKAKLTNNYSPDGKTLVSESKWFWVHTKAFTVTHSWNSSGVCSGCGSKKSCSHSWSSAVTLLPALKTAGEETATCSICKTIRVSKLPSVWDSCKHLELPAQLSVLDAAAFSDTAVELIVIPADTVEIGAQAFAGCSALKALVFEGEPESIAEDAVSAGSSITVYCQKGGTVEAWAKQLGLKVSYS